MDTSRGRGSKLRKLSIGPKLVLRQLRSDATVVVSLSLVLLITSVFLAAAPRLFNEKSDDALRHAISDAPPILRNVSVARSRIISASPLGDVFANVEFGGASFRESEMPETLQALISHENYVVDSPRFVAAPLPGEPAWPFPTFFHVRYQQAVLDHVRIVAGSRPRPREPILVPVADDEAEGGDEPETTAEELLPLYEVAVTNETLADLEVGLGDRFLVTADIDQTAYRDVPRERLGFRLVFEVSGIVAPVNPDEDYWYEDFQLHRSSIFENPDVRLIFATGLMSPDDYRGLLRETGGGRWTYGWRYFLDPERVDAGTVDQLADDIRNLEVRYRSISVARPPDVGVTTGLSRLISRYLDQRGSAVSILATVSLGLFAVALAVVTLLAALVAARQRGSLFLLRSRGASPRQLATSRVFAGLLLSVPTALIGLVIAQLLVPGRSSPLSWQAALAVVIGATLLIVGVTLPAIRRDLGVSPTSTISSKLTLRRKVLESGVVLVAIVAAAMLRRRGLVGESSGENGASFDPLLAAAPALLAVALGIVTLRLYGYPIRLAAWMAAKRRDTVAFVGLRRVLQQPAAARLPLLVIVLASAVAVFAGTTRVSIYDGQQESTWQEVGADFRISGAGETTPLPGSLDLSGVASIEESAFGVRSQGTHRPPAGGTILMEFLGLEAADYAAVVAGTRADPHLPRAVTEVLTGPGIGTESNPVPAVVATEWAERQQLEIGDSFSLDLGTFGATFTVAAKRNEFPSMPIDRPFVVADSDNMKIAGGAELRPSLLYVRAAEAAFDDIDATLQAQAPHSVVTSRFTLFETISEAPLAAVVSDGSRLAFWLATLLAVFAVIATFALTARSRLRDLAYLGVVGLSSRQAVGVTLLEQLPPTLIAAAVGSGMGVGIALLSEPGIDLTAFTGAGLPAAVRIDVTGIALVVVGLPMVALLAVGISRYLTRAESLGVILRMGQE